jgi:hypothetical protein
LSYKDRSEKILLVVIASLPAVGRELATWQSYFLISYRW